MRFSFSMSASEAGTKNVSGLSLTCHLVPYHRVQRLCPLLKHDCRYIKRKMSQALYLEGQD
jgi:hypothetical protein